MQRLLLFLFLVAGFGTMATAQDEAIFGHYHISPIILHPAAAGFNNTHQLQFHARAAWTGFAETPKTVMAQYNGPVGNTFGFGVSALSEKAAQLNRNRIRGSFAFRFQVRDNVRLAAGFSTEYQRLSLNNDALESNYLEGGDETLQEYIDGKDVYDASVGLYGSINERTYMGVSFINLVRARLDDIILIDNEQESFFKYYTFTAGHRFDIVDLNFTLEPSIMLRQVRDAPFMMDINVKAGFLDDQLVTGLSYRSLGQVGLLLGTKFSGIQLFYSYDVSFQNFQRHNTGLHEVTVSFNFRKKAQPGDPNYTKVKYQKNL